MESPPAGRNTKYVLYSVIVLLLVLSASLGIYGFGKTTQTVTAMGAGSTTRSGALVVLATFFPLQDWARNIGGARANVSLLVPATTDVHEFEPTPSSIQAVANANLLILNGAGLEPWAPQVIAAAGNPGVVVVNASQGIDLIRVPLQFQSNGRTVDPHTWLDPADAEKMVQNILQGFMKADPADSAYFTANARTYEAKLASLDQQFVSLSTSSIKVRYFVTFHTAFGYFARQYNLTQIPVFGPFEEEPTPSDIQNVVAAIHLYQLCYVGYESLENPAIPSAIATQTGATLVPMNPIEGLTTDEQAAGQTFLTLMSQTLLVLTLSLNHIGCN